MISWYLRFEIFKLEKVIMAAFCKKEKKSSFPNCIFYKELQAKFKFFLNGYFLLFLPTNSSECSYVISHWLIYNTIIKRIFYFHWKKLTLWFQISLKITESIPRNSLKKLMKFHVIHWFHFALSSKYFWISMKNNENQINFEWYLIKIHLIIDWISCESGTSEKTIYCAQKLIAQKYSINRKLKERKKQDTNIKKQASWMLYICQDYNYF
jgi:hypothetical protein